MDLIELFNYKGTEYSAYDGRRPPVNPLTTKQSKLHNVYSIDGSNISDIRKQFNLYLDGGNDFLPLPSEYDLNGKIPTKALTDPYVVKINNSFAKGTYLDNIPG
jgi:hypothetical protein